MIRFLREYVGPATDLGACELVLGELLANAVRHAPPGRIGVDLDWSGPRPLLRVTDPGPGFTHTFAVPDEASEGGRGLYIVALLASEPRVQPHPGSGCSVSVQLPVLKPAP